MPSSTVPRNTRASAVTQRSTSAVQPHEVGKKPPEAAATPPIRSTEPTAATIESKAAAPGSRRANAARSLRRAWDIPRSQATPLSDALNPHAPRPAGR